MVWLQQVNSKWKQCDVQVRLKCDVQVRLNDKHIERVSVFKYLGLWLDETLSFNEHIGQISKKVNKRLGILSTIRKNVTKDTVWMLYKSLVLPNLQYGTPVQIILKTPSKNYRTGHAS